MKNKYFFLFLFFSVLLPVYRANAQITRNECISTIQAYSTADVPGANPNLLSGIKAHLAAIAPDCPSDVMNAFYRQQQLELQQQQMQNQTTTNCFNNGVGIICNTAPSMVGF